MKKRKLNIELFKKIRDRIAEIPESYNQQAWYTESTKAPCGTAACLAGEAIICAAPTVKTGVRRLRRMHVDDGVSVATRAASLLNLPEPEWKTFSFLTESSDNDTARLFRCGSDGLGRPLVYWPDPFGKRFNKAKTNKARAKAAVAYLDHIIETGSVLVEGK